MTIRYIDLFCGIGGFRVASERSFKSFGIDSECVFSSDIDTNARKMYYTNFGEYPAGDITKIEGSKIPDHDLLFAGFPCQPFSIMGDKKGFDDIRGTLFFDIARILRTKKPRAFILENVKQLVTHHKGHTFRRILETLETLNYSVSYKILNALDYGLPQKRERVFIVGFYKPLEFKWPRKSDAYKSLSDILELIVDDKYYASERIRDSRRLKHQSDFHPGVWHENKSGNVNSHPYSCALRAGASYNYLLVNGERRLTPRELLRLQGFPDSYKIVVPYTQIRKQTGNAVPVNVVEAILDTLLPILIKDIVSSNGKKRNRNLYARQKTEIAEITHSR